jgi:HlyD family secretion protein
VERRDLLVTVTATGTLQPTNQVEIGSEVSGAIQRVFVDFNDSVTAGQAIAELDTAQLEARVASARAALAVQEASLLQAEATLTEAQAKLKRSRELASQSIASQQALEADEASAKRAAAQVASARAQGTSAQASLREAETALGKAVIRAPIGGVVISRSVDPGQTVAASFQTPVLFKIAEDLRHMELHLDVDESDIGRVTEGQMASFRVDAYPGQTFAARIVSVRFNPRQVNNVVTYETVLAVDNPEMLLRPGMTATADILIAERDDVLLVPNRALRFIPPTLESASRPDEPGARVWVVRPGAVAPAAVAVTTGLSNEEHTELTGRELEAGTEVIIDVERAPRSAQQGGPFG